MLYGEYYCCVKNKNVVFAKNFYEFLKLLSAFHFFIDCLTFIEKLHHRVGCGKTSILCSFFAGNLEVDVCFGQHLVLDELLLVIEHLELGHLVLLHLLVLHFHDRLLEQNGQKL